MSRLPGRRSRKPCTRTFAGDAPGLSSVNSARGVPIITGLPAGRALGAAAAAAVAAAVVAGGAFDGDVCVAGAPTGGVTVGGGVVELVIAAVLSDPGAGERDDGNRIGVTMKTIAISTSARMVRLSMRTV